MGTKCRFVHSTEESQALKDLFAELGSMPTVGRFRGVNRSGVVKTHTALSTVIFLNDVKA